MAWELAIQEQSFGASEDISDDQYRFMVLSSDQLRELCEVCKKHGIVFISDEIYHGITYGTQKEATAVSFSDSVGNLELG